VSEATLSRRALNRATLARQMLLRRERLKPGRALERIAGMQAQLARPPFIGLWSRIEGFQRDDLVRAIDRREVVRATMMRATLHLFSRKDFVAFRPVLQRELSRAMASVLRDRAKGLAVDKLVAASRRFFEQEPRTFAELRKHLGGLFPGLDERAMGYIVRTHLPLIQTPAAGSPWAYPAVADFAVAESWIGERLKDGERPHALALRYFAAFGPASVRDLQTWSGLAAARAIVDELRPRLRMFRDEGGRELVDLPEAPRPAGDEEAAVRFLPEFDNLLLAYAERTRIIADEHRPAIFRKNLLVPATFLVDGFVGGLWHVERKKSLARLSVKPFGTLGKQSRTALVEEGEKLLRFIEPDAQTCSVAVAAA
jgi:hypothetical protein